MNARFDPIAFKTTTRELWDQHARGWDAHTAQLRKATDAMLAMAEVGPGDRVLDVAAGAGDQTLDIAERVGSAGAVLATDLSPAILEFARDRAQSAGHRNVGTLAVDGENLNVDENSFDAAICRLGLMFFPDPGKGLREMYRALKPGGRACTMVFSSPDANPCVSILLSTGIQARRTATRRPVSTGRPAQPRQTGLDRRPIPTGWLFPRGDHEVSGAVQAAIREGVSRFRPKLGEPDLADPTPARRVRETGRLGGNRNQTERASETGDRDLKGLPTRQPIFETRLQAGAARE